MNREDIIRMAREAGFRVNTTESLFEELERFAAFVVSHALVEPCCGNYDQCQKVCMPRAAFAEREACIKIVEDEAFQYASPVWAFEIVNDIKARGQA